MEQKLIIEYLAELSSPAGPVRGWSKACPLNTFDFCAIEHLVESSHIAFILKKKKITTTRRTARTLNFHSSYNTFKASQISVHTFVKSNMLT